MKHELRQLSFCVKVLIRETSALLVQRYTYMIIGVANYVG